MPRKSAIVGIAVAILALALWRFVQPAPAYDLRITQLTFDSGLTAWPAISPDGRTVAYASDRDTGSNLELYLQPALGGSPKRLTQGSENNSEPAFSPDGATLAFYSTDAGGGIYTMQVTGGEARLVAPGGHTPRYSPDGRWIAYSDAAGASIVAATGGTPRRIHPELQAVRAPSWSPDGRLLAFWSAGDLLVAPVEGGNAESSGIGARLAKAGTGNGPFPDALWTSFGLIFSARAGFARNLYRCPLDRNGKANGDIVRLTNGTEIMGEPSVSREGRVVFSSGRQRFDIWGVPLDGDSGKVTGQPYRITDTLAPTSDPDLSADGKTLLFGSSRNGFTEVWEKELPNGVERLAATSPEGASYGRLLRSSREILHVRSAGGHDELYLGDRRVAAGTRAWDAGGNAATLLVSGAGIDSLDVASGQRTPLIEAPAQTLLSDASYSPDYQWIIFAAESKVSSGIYVVPAHGGKWLSITAPTLRAGKPRFSPNGSMIYFTREGRNGREIDAVRFDSLSGAPRDEPFAVVQTLGLRLSLSGVSAQALDIAVAKDKLATIFCQQTATIWLGDLVPHQ